MVQGSGPVPVALHVAVSHDRQVVWRTSGQCGVAGVQKSMPLLGVGRRQRTHDLRGQVASFMLAWLLRTDASSRMSDTPGTHSLSVRHAVCSACASDDRHSKSRGVMWWTCSNCCNKDPDTPCSTIHVLTSICTHTNTCHLPQHGMIVCLLLCRCADYHLMFDRVMFDRDPPISHLPSCSEHAADHDGQ